MIYVPCNPIDYSVQSRELEECAEELFTVRPVTGFQFRIPSNWPILI
jgi:hypothetical protein